MTGIIDVDGKLPNLALMKIKSFYKNAEWAWPINYTKYDKIYVSSIFNDSDKSFLPKNAITGGTGFDVSSKLPPEIEKCQPDYSLYLKSTVSIQRYSTGCIRKCPFCVVSKKEGNIKPVEPLNLNPRGKWIHLLDNNFFASPNWREAIHHLINCNQPVQFEGVDIRILTSEMLHQLMKVKIKSQIHIAWDNPKDNIDRIIDKIIPNKKRYKFMCYVLVGYWSTPDQDLCRVMRLSELGIDPFVMPFNKSDRYQKKFARWVNRKEIFKSCKWSEYHG